MSLVNPLPSRSDAEKFHASLVFACQRLLIGVVYELMNIVCPRSLLIMGLRLFSGRSIPTLDTIPRKFKSLDSDIIADFCAQEESRGAKRAATYTSTTNKKRVGDYKEKKKKAKKEMPMDFCPVIHFRAIDWFARVVRRRDTTDDIGLSIMAHRLIGGHVRWFFESLAYDAERKIIVSEQHLNIVTRMARMLVEKHDRPLPASYSPEKHITLAIALYWGARRFARSKRGVNALFHDSKNETRDDSSMNMLGIQMALGGPTVLDSNQHAYKADPIKAVGMGKIIFDAIGFTPAEQIQLNSIVRKRLEFPDRVDVTPKFKYIWVDQEYKAMGEGPEDLDKEIIRKIGGRDKWPQYCAGAAFATPGYASNTLRNLLLVYLCRHHIWKNYVDRFQPIVDFKTLPSALTTSESTDFKYNVPPPAPLTPLPQTESDVPVHIRINIEVKGPIAGSNDMSHMLVPIPIMAPSSTDVAIYPVAGTAATTILPSTATCSSSNNKKRSALSDFKRASKRIRTDTDLSVI